MKTIGLAAWKGDIAKHFLRRAEHLLEKQGVDGWIWIVRRTNDCTDRLMKALAEQSPTPLLVIEESWPASDDRLLTLSVMADALLNEALMRGAERVLYHESDLISPRDIAVRLSQVMEAGENRGAVGGWPCLASDGMDESLHLYPGAFRIGTNLQMSIGDEPAVLPLFYDTWGYRLDDKRFASNPPYAPCYRADEPFRLDTIGSVALIDAKYLHAGARMGHYGFVHLCDRIRSMGGEVWCDPRIVINQPLELWTFETN